MKQLVKRTAALACAMLMTVGGFSQASAGSISRNLQGAKMTGSATKTTTIVTATTTYNVGTSGASSYYITTTAYAKVNNVKQYGEKMYEGANKVTASVPATVYIMSGIGGTGYGGDHYLQITIKYPNALSDTFNTGICTSTY